MNKTGDQNATETSADITVRNWRSELKQGDGEPQSMPGADKINGKWNQRIGSPKITWGKLTRSRF